jgi:hypothetical protein
VGGLVGGNWGNVAASFWDIETSGQTTSDGGTGKTTAEMHDPNTFIDSGWDFVGEFHNGPNDDWAEPAGVGYPILWWQLSPLPELPFSVGTGTPHDPFLISTADELNRIGRNPRLMTANFKLINDINIGGVNLFIIGSKIFPFIGVFDGNGNTIFNFSFDAKGMNYVGLFACVDGPNAEIKDLGLIAPNVNADGDCVGSLVGYFGEGTITDCYVEGGNVSGSGAVGGLVGSVGSQYNYSSGKIINCYSTGTVAGNENVGGLVGHSNSGTITNCYSTGSVSGASDVGGLVGQTYGNITNCESTCSVWGDRYVGGLVGSNSGTITYCYLTGSVEGDECVGGLVGRNFSGTITNCYSTTSVSGESSIGGLVGWNYYGAITNCYSRSSVIGTSAVGGLVGQNGGCISEYRCFPGTISNCYSAGSVEGVENVGGLVGYNEDGNTTDSFWDIEISGKEWSDGGTGLTTAEMQTMSTFIDTGWDFNTPVWTIDEGVDYPRLWWEFVPVLYAEPEITLGTSNRISWEPIAGDIEYYTECAEDANFTNIVYNSGWITETSCEFTGLQIDQRYWYSVKARNSAGIESQWSNMESSLQCTLSDVVETLLSPVSLKNKNMKNALLNKIDEALEMIDEDLYKDALNKLEQDILQKTDGCADTGEPDKNDWIITCEGQTKIYPLVIETIEYVRSLMEQ